MSKEKQKLIWKYQSFITNLNSYIDCYENSESSRDDVNKCRGQIEAYQQVIKDLSK